MARKPNLPMCQTTIHLLQEQADIALAHVSAYGPIKQQPEWTRAQWGNFNADKLTKRSTEDQADKHIIWPMQELEGIAMTYSPWHWVSEKRYLLLEPLQ